MALVQHLRRAAAAAATHAPAWRASSSSAAAYTAAAAFSPSTTSRAWMSSSSSFGRSADGDSALSTQFSVRNGATVPGRLHLQLPLPGLPGLSSVQLDDAKQSVEGLIETIKKRDASLKSVEITTTNGTKLARTVKLSELTAMEFILRLNHVNILVQNDGAKAGAQHLGENAAFASVKAHIETDSRPFLPLAEYYRICLTAGAEEPVANKWLRELQRRNLVTHFDRSTDAELKNAVILRPHSPESIARLQSALDSELSEIKRERKTQETRLEELTSELKKALAIEAETRKVAQKLPNAQKWVTLTGLTSFYGGLMYLVWDVYSWDVMEPITYFIGFTAVLGNSFYHTVTKKDPTYTNIWQKKYQKRLAAVQEERKFQPAKIDALRCAIEDVERDIETLAKWEGKPPQSPSVA